MISICLCTYNGEQYLEKQLNSIILQKANQYISEIIICDDKSDDSTIKIINKFSKKIKNLKLVINNQRLGAKKNFEKCLRLAKFPIIIFCDQDDIWDEYKITQILKHKSLLENKSVCVMHNASLINSFDEIVCKDFMQLRGGFSKSILKNFIKNRFLGCCLTINSTLKNKVLPFPKFVAQHDIWIGIVSSIYAKNIYIDKNLTLYRTHNNNASNASKNKKSNILNIIKFRLFFIYCIIILFIRKFNLSN